MRRLLNCFTRKFQDGVKNSAVATEATKTATKVPRVPAKLSKNCTDVSLKDLRKPLPPMHVYSFDLVKYITCLVTNIE